MIKYIVTLFYHDILLYSRLFLLGTNFYETAEKAFSIFSVIAKSVRHKPNLFVSLSQQVELSSGKFAEIGLCTHSSLNSK